MGLKKSPRARTLNPICARITVAIEPTAAPSEWPPRGARCAEGGSLQASEVRRVKRKTANSSLYRATSFPAGWRVPVKARRFVSPFAYRGILVQEITKN